MPKKTKKSPRAKSPSPASTPYQIEKADVLVIGSGGAGLRTAIELQSRGIDVLVVGKCKKREAHTIAATGGINAALGNMDPDDSWQLHAADTIRDGGHINDTDAVMLLCKHAPAAIRELDEWRVGFAKSSDTPANKHRAQHFKKFGKASPDPKILQRFFGAATYRRACFIGDMTGKAILDTLVDQSLKRKIRFKSEIYIFSLLHHHGVATGAVGFDSTTGNIIVFHAKLIVMATGGHSRMFARSSSAFWENNGDGIALATRLGAKTMDMEMFQFHPTGMVYPKAAEGILVTEAVRGEGGILTNSKGERFMKRYDPERMELSARDVVARAVYQEVEAGRGTKRGGVYLDISHLPKAYILKRLPKMYKQFKDFVGLDISKQKMEIAPTAHYSMGGLYTDPARGTTTVPRLYAVGEVTSGVHGGNRLGGNSLAEILVFGRLTGKHIAMEVPRTKWLPLDASLVGEQIEEMETLRYTKSGKDPIDTMKRIQDLMWKNVGVVRTGSEMKHALAQLQTLKKIKLKPGSSIAHNQKLIAAYNVRNMIPTCEMIIRSALERRESRAAHFRSDYPNTDPKWKRNIVCTPSPTGLHASTSRPIALTTRPVKRVSASITRRMNTKKSTRLLE